MRVSDASPVVVVAGLAAFALIIAAVVLLAEPGDEGTQRIGLFLAAMAPAILGLVALLRADQAASNTNGKLDARIEAAVHRANAARRRGDEPLTPAEVDDLHS